MPNYDRDQIQCIKEANNIVDVIGATVELKRSGANFVGMCPWCDGKKPKLTVSPEYQSYKCWRCNERGDVVKWIMQTMNLKFPEALEHLARRAGLSF
jgi:DNA primase